MHDGDRICPHPHRKMEFYEKIHNLHFFVTNSQISLGVQCGIAILREAASRGTSALADILVKTSITSPRSRSRLYLV